MPGVRSRSAFCVLSLLWSAGAGSQATGATVVPPGSAMGQLGKSAQHLLISACEGSEQIDKRAWLLDALTVSTTDVGIEPTCGQTALRFAGEAREAGAKGDFVLSRGLTRPCKMLGVWISLPADANVDRAGLQFVDSEGEYLFAHVSADWSGWKWFEVDLSRPAVVQAYPQADKNGKFDGAASEISVIWYSKKPGPSSVIVDGLVAAVEPDGSANSGLRVSLAGSTSSEPGRPLAASLMLSNLSEKPVRTTVSYSLQENPTLIELIAPDPEYGTDHARGAKSWTECEGARIEEGSLTDGSDLTSAGTDYRSAHFTEAFQYVDLGSERQITHLRYTSGDSNWYWKVDFGGSSDGKQYTPIEGLQNLDWHQKWGRNQQPVTKPFAARYLRLRYHKDGEKVDVIRMPVTLSVYDGLDDESPSIPQVGTEVASGEKEVEVAGGSFAVVPLGTVEALSPGSYFLATKASGEAKSQVTHANVFVMPPAMEKVSPASRFGMNAAEVNYAAMNRRLGVGWIRFENVKWPFVSPSPGVYAYDGSVGPWHVKMDEIVARYHDLGLSVLPTMFLTPPYLASDKAPSTEAALVFPPRELAPYGEFTFQTVARYGGARHEPQALKTTDKKSGLAQMGVYELWNEPDLNDPGWGSWRGPYEQYLEMFRFGAEGVKRADPSAIVTSGGLGEFKLDAVDRLRTYRYADGKAPLDFMDVLNVHHYTGVVAPELATADFNVQRSLDARGEKTYEQELQLLSAWRDQHKPGMPIWLTETGYETGGQIAVSERKQAAYLVRNVMLALANGVEKVFIFREAGSGVTLWSASGVVRNDGSYKPSWFTYATLIRQLDGVTEGRRLLHPDPNVRLYRWKRGRETLLSAWAVEGEAKAELKLGKCRVTDAFGRTRESELQGEVPLSILPMYITEVRPEGLEWAEEVSERQEQLARGEKQRLSRLKAYLFDFGSREHVGTVELGGERLCTPVLSTDLWEPAKSYGFGPKPGMNSEVFGGDAVKRDKMEGDAVRLGSDTRFWLKADPGRYRLQIRSTALEPTLSFTITGLNGGSKTLTTKGDSVVQADVEVGDEPLSIQADHYLLLKWLTLIEQH